MLGTGIMAKLALDEPWSDGDDDFHDANDGAGAGAGVGVGAGAGAGAGAGTVAAVKRGANDDGRADANFALAKRARVGQAHHMRSATAGPALEGALGHVSAGDDARAWLTRLRARESTTMGSNAGSGQSPKDAAAAVPPARDAATSMTRPAEGHVVHVAVPDDTNNPSAPSTPLHSSRERPRLRSGSSGSASYPALSVGTRSPHDRVASLASPATPLAHARSPPPLRVGHSDPHTGRSPTSSEHVTPGAASASGVSPKKEDPRASLMAAIVARRKASHGGSPAGRSPAPGDLGKYRKMLKVGVPPGGVAMKMRQAGIDEAAIEALVGPARAKAQGSASAAGTRLSPQPTRKRQGRGTPSPRRAGNATRGHSSPGAGAGAGAGACAGVALKDDPQYAKVSAGV